MIPTCKCSSCESGVILLGHCVDIDGNEWHSCTATSPDGEYKKMDEQPTGPIVSVEPGDPNNDQMLALTTEALRAVLDKTIHPLIDQGEAQGADLPMMTAALVLGWQEQPEHMPADLALSMLALAVLRIAADERQLGLL